ncbi:hypothetical protein PsYK624_129490 [Phanerochaete sordida]|uniref:Uncharacterized protein n=1 Tax=Phanerochaete sordida TaxID=48140 RepID=A0A9P3GKT1_9APHY|nr:hypothetical protein PsYK624_129490 [Phanerochaete sordida]
MELWTRGTGGGTANPFSHLPTYTNLAHFAVYDFGERDFTSIAKTMSASASTLTSLTLVCDMLMHQRHSGPLWITLPWSSLPALRRLALGVPTGAGIRQFLLFNTSFWYHILPFMPENLDFLELAWAPYTTCHTPNRETVSLTMAAAPWDKICNEIARANTKQVRFRLKHPAFGKGWSTDVRRHPEKAALTAHLNVTFITGGSPSCDD